jgi:hypothetical protein
MAHPQYWGQVLDLLPCPICALFQISDLTLNCRSCSSPLQRMLLAARGNEKEGRGGSSLPFPAPFGAFRQPGLWARDPEAAQKDGKECRWGGMPRFWNFLVQDGSNRESLSGKGPTARSAAIPNVMMGLPCFGLCDELTGLPFWSFSNPRWGTP